MSSKQPPASGLCICKLCTCGRHHCPHQSIKQVPVGPCTLSEYTNEYTRHPLPSIHSYKPVNTYRRSGAPLDDKTNHRIDYIPYPLEKRFVHHADPYNPPDGEFERNTTYTTEYLPKKGERAMAFRRTDQPKELGKFEGTPSYKSDYQSWPISPREVYGKSPEWVVPIEAFDGVPSYKTDYVKYNDVTPRGTFKPVNNYQGSDTPFQSDTDYRRSYKQHPMEARFVKEKIEWYPPSVPFQGATTTHSDYKEKPLSINKSYKPLSTAKMSGAPLQSQTTQRCDYLPWGVERPFKHQAAPYQPPEGEIASDTTYIREYRQYQSPGRTLGFKPQANRGELANFDARSSYSDEFKRYQIAARTPYGPNREWMPSEEPFETQTTHSLHYKPQKIDIRTSFKKSNETHLTDAPFNAISTYKTEYRPIEVEICPTTLMNSPRATWGFTGKVSEGGHMFVEPIGAGNVINNDTSIEVAVH